MMRGPTLVFAGPVGRANGSVGFKSKVDINIIVKETRGHMFEMASFHTSEPLVDVTNPSQQCTAFDICTDIAERAGQGCGKDSGVVEGQGMSGTELLPFVAAKDPFYW
ncbi:hypothetical protein BD779DRAFT_1465362 [Infundibulicybe gibba]|nr:hypothetical protein BD779DRAFT_1465362 [Infundibulicybe gibba]